MFSEIQPISLREQVVEQIRTAIIEGRLKPNDHIVEATLTKQLGVSRTPVREALILLEREGLVVSVTNRGSFVRAFNPDDVDTIFSMRTTLENFAAEITIDHFSEEELQRLDDSMEKQRHSIETGDFKSVRSIDMSFHRFLINKSNHPLLIRSWTEIVAQIAALLYIRAEGIPDYDEYLAIRDHKSIVDGYKDRDLQAVMVANRRINDRVAGECRLSVIKLAE